MSELRNILSAAYRTVRGGGNPSLLRRKAYHVRREVEERAVLAEATTDPSLFQRNSCPACGEASSSADFVNRIGFSFSVCRADGTVYMNPVPTEATLARLYNHDSYGEYWSVGHHPDPVDVVNVQGLHPERLLDVGCATGEFLDQFACARHGVELCAETAEVARRKGHSITTGTIADVQDVAPFDVIAMLQLIEHLTAPASPLADVRRLLKPTGHLYLNTPCIDSASFQLFRERHMHVSGFGHVSLYSKTGLQALARNNGFEVVAHGYSGGLDIALHDLIAYRVSRRRFRHRCAFYSQRFVSACDLVERVTRGQLTKALRPRGNQSYQWAIWRKA